MSGNFGKMNGDSESWRVDKISKNKSTSRDRVEKLSSMSHKETLTFIYKGI